MNADNDIIRYEELEAGRVLGDLDAEEIKELEALQQKLGVARDPSIELVAATIESDYLMDDSEPLPEALVSKLREDAAKFMTDDTKDTSVSDKVVSISAWRRILGSPVVAWSFAAALMILVAVTFNRTPDDTGGTVVYVSEPTPEEAKEALAATASDAQTSSFSGLPGYEGMSGSIIWSDDAQEGYMTLTDLPVNDPGRNQYQLWIVDPTRDDEPVDGGVFDIPAGQKTVVVKVNNPLEVSKPAAFLITLEKPGGVVVSTQDVKVALAQPSA